MESEFRRKAALEIDPENELLQAFERTKLSIARAPVFNQEIYAKMQAFDWVYQTCKMLEGKLEVDESRVLDLSFW